MSTRPTQPPPQFSGQGNLADSSFVPAISPAIRALKNNLKLTNLDAWLAAARQYVTEFTFSENVASGIRQWSPTRSYKAGELCIWRGSLWIARHDSGTNNFEPGTEEGTLWQRCGFSPNFANLWATMDEPLKLTNTIKNRQTVRPGATSYDQVTWECDLQAQVPSLKNVHMMLLGDFGMDVSPAQTSAWNMALYKKAFREWDQGVHGTQTWGQFYQGSIGQDGDGNDIMGYIGVPDMSQLTASGVNHDAAYWTAFWQGRQTASWTTFWANDLFIEESTYYDGIGMWGWRGVAVNNQFETANSKGQVQRIYQVNFGAGQTIQNGGHPFIYPVLNDKFTITRSLAYYGAGVGLVGTSNNPDEDLVYWTAPRRLYLFSYGY